MILDFQQSSMAMEGILSFPDFAFGAVPLKPSAIKETPQIIGRNDANNLSVQASIGTSVAGQGSPFPGS